LGTEITRSGRDGLVCLSRSKGAASETGAHGKPFRSPSDLRVEDVLERVGDHAVAGGVRVDVGSERRRGAHPRPLADAQHVERDAADRRRVGRREGALDVGDRIPIGGIDPLKEVVEGDRGSDAPSKRGSLGKQR
jgi:hypothetical protein